MPARNKPAQQLARQLVRLSVVDGVVSPEQVTGVLDYLEKHQPPHLLQVLKAYQRAIAAAVARSRAIVEHAGDVPDDALRSIETALSRHYGRAITASTRRNDTLLAGLRIRVADDVYESSIDSQLSTLAIAS